MMVQNHFDDETLIKVIDISTTDFDVSEDALVDLMKQAGYRRVKNLVGGILRWSDDVDPSVPKY